jgi:homoserine/homoserine lactone efflux protein
MTWDSYFAFVLAACALAFVPGPTVTVIIANSLRFGAKAGLANVIGTQVGVAIWLLIAAVGLEAAIRVMGVWFDLLRYIGAAYLVWMGIKLFMSKGDLAVATDRARPNGSFFLQGLVVILSNPKMLVLFGALIPPFIPHGSDGSPLLQSQRLVIRFMLWPQARPEPGFHRSEFEPLKSSAAHASLAVRPGWC